MGKGTRVLLARLTASMGATLGVVFAVEYARAAAYAFNNVVWRAIGDVGVKRRVAAGNGAADRAHVLWDVRAQNRVLWNHSQNAKFRDDP